MRVLLVAMILLLGGAAHGCAEAEAGRARNASAEHAECLVCKHNADLACVDITVDDKTPRAEYQGKTYCFCSETCRQEFLKNPAKYVAALPR